MNGAICVLDAESKSPPRRHLMPVEDSIEALALPPHSSDAEQSVLGALLQDNAVAERVCELLTPEDSYVRAHREIYRHIGRLIASEQPADAITVAESSSLMAGRSA